jgi:hypothetical protein
MSSTKKKEILSSQRDMSDLFFAKDVQFRDLQIGLFSINTSTDEDFEFSDVVNYEQFNDVKPSIILNPCCVIVYIWGLHDSHGEDELGNNSAISLEFSSKNIEFSPNYFDFFLLRDTLLFLSTEVMRLNIRLYRRCLFGINNDKFSPKKMWQFAVKSVIAMIRNKGNITSLSSIGNYSVILKLRNTYVSLYRKVMAYRLGIVRDLKKDKSEECIETGLDMFDKKKFDEIHDFFGIHYLLQFRETIHSELLKKGISLKMIKKAILGNKMSTNNSIWKYFAGENINSVNHLEYGHSNFFLMIFNYKFHF